MAGKIRGQQIKDDSITGVDVDENTLVLKHFVQAKYTATSSNSKIYIRFQDNGSNTSPGVNNKFVAPSAGHLKYVLVRSTGTPGSTVIGLHKAPDGTSNLNTTAAEEETCNLSNADTVVKVPFNGGGTEFAAHSVIGISVNPTNNYGNVNLVIVLELQPF